MEKKCKIFDSLTISEPRGFGRGHRVTMKRPIDLKTGNYYHVMNKSIADFVIFNSPDEYERMMRAICYYQNAQQKCALSDLLRMNELEMAQFLCDLSKKQNLWVEILAFCLMPTHVHFLLKQCLDDGISTFMGNLLNSYARYFNKKHGRKGPLWVGRFKAVQMKTDEQLRHVSRYIHLNPTTDGLVKKPEHWNYSSYLEYLGSSRNKILLTTGREILNCTPQEYKKFSEDQISYQRELAAIKHLILE